MYNEEQKSAFLSEFDGNKAATTLIKNTFLQLSDFEDRFRKDFALFDLEELNASIPDIAGVRFETAEVIVSNLRRYVKWCASNGHPHSACIFDYDPNIADDKIRSCFVRSPEHLRFVIDSVFEEREKNTIEYIYRTYLWLAYFGFSEKEAAAVKSEDVDFDQMCIYTGGDNIRQIYEESLDDLYRACSMTEFTEIKRHVVTIDRVAGNEILRGKPTSKTIEESVETTFRQSVSKIFKKAKDKQDGHAYVDPDLRSINLSFKRVFLSGTFYRAYQVERIGETVDFDAIVDERYERGRSKYTHADDQTQKMKYHMKRGYLEDYEGWKRAFELNKNG